jgi:uncharacterized peroxidase-related enzyme
MSFVGLIPESQAPPEVQQLYRQIREVAGFLPNYFQAVGRDPGIIKGHLAFGDAVTRDGALSRALKEQIALVVSGLNTSSYCIAAHMEVLHHLGIEKALSRKLATDYANAPVDEKTKALFRAADKLTRTPDEFGEADIAALRESGWDTPAIFEAVMTIAYYNCVARVSIGLGLVADF